MSEQSSQWSSKLIFIVATAGAAVGLGNIWKFPYITGLHGGGAFGLVYLGCILVCGLPILMAEIALGRLGRKNPADALSDIAAQSNTTQKWSWAGLLAIFTGALILTYYSVIAGWTMDYTYQALQGAFTSSQHLNVDGLFNHLLSSPTQLIFWHTLFMLITLLIVSQGVNNGIERAMWIMFPAMLTILIVLLIYAVDTGYFWQGVHYLLYPDFKDLTAQGYLAAMGQAFFSLSIATGTLMVYGSYLPKNISIANVSIWVVVADTGIALLAGIIIFPIVFANHLEASAGAGLIFKTLPIAFTHMPFPRLISTLFFLMLFFAALTSSISLIEPAISWMIQHKKFSRSRATLMIGTLVWFVGLGSVFAFNEWEHIKIFGLNLFEASDYLASNITMPLGGLLFAVFATWFANKAAIKNELDMRNNTMFEIWYCVTRYISPLAVLVIILHLFKVV